MIWSGIGGVRCCRALVGDAGGESNGEGGAESMVL
jgi:hypothetical protein